MSNSKLSDSQKQTLKRVKRDNPDIHLFSFPECGVTVAVRRTGETMGEFSVSIMSNLEQKFRRKVGEYWAINRMLDGQVLPCVMPEEHVMKTWASNLAENLGCY